MEAKIKRTMVKGGGKVKGGGQKQQSFPCQYYQ